MMNESKVKLSKAQREVLEMLLKPDTRGYDDGMIYIRGEFGRVRIATINALRRGGMISCEGDRIYITPAGLAAIAPEPTPAVEVNNEPSCESCGRVLISADGQCATRCNMCRAIDGEIAMFTALASDADSQDEMRRAAGGL